MRGNEPTEDPRLSRHHILLQGHHQACRLGTESQQNLRLVLDLIVFGIPFESRWGGGKLV